MSAPKPEAYVWDALLAVLPAGVPTPIAKMEHARFEGTGRRRVALASVTMFDGLTATVRVSEAGPCTSHGYSDWQGGALSFERGKWRRVSLP